MENNKNGSLYGAIACIVLGVGWAHFFAGEFITFLGSGVAFAFAIFLAADWFFRQRAEEARALLRADPSAPANVAFSIAQLSPEMQANLIAARLMIRVIPNFQGPIIQWQFRGDPENRWYSDLAVREVWSLASQDGGMPPIRDFSEGSQQRAAAVALTQWFVSAGWAQPSSGNKSAQFVTGGFEQASRSLWGE